VKAVDSIDTICAMCRFFLQRDESIDEIGFCHRHAPRPSRREHPDSIVWPKVYGDDFCGEWQPSEAAKEYGIAEAVEQAHIQWQASRPNKEAVSS
jgi:hypothetical protein